MSQTHQYEYEERAFLTEDQFLRIKGKLEALAVSHEIDNKTSYFFVLPHVNVSIASSHKKTVIKYKGGQLGNSNGFKEIEIPVDPAFLEDSVQLFSSALAVEPQLSEQFRINYQLSDGIEVALKYTQTWGFHLEAEKTFTHSEDISTDKENAKAALDLLAESLGISYIDDATMQIAKKEWASGAQYGTYTPNEFHKKYATLFV